MGGRDRIKKGYKMRLIKGLFLAACLAGWAFAQQSVSGYQGIVDYLLDVAKGRIHNEFIVNKFGHNPAVAVTGEDIWAGGGAYAFYPDTARVMELIADSSADSIGATGALTVAVYGLDSGYIAQVETVTVTGTAPALLANQYIRMYRAIVLTAGSREVNVGAITIQDTSTARSNPVGAYIAAKDGQTQQAIYTIPAGKKGYFLKGAVTMDNDTFQGNSATFVWKIREINGGNGAWRVKGQATTINIGNGAYSWDYAAPPMIPGKTDIKIECTTASAITGAEATFDLLIVED